MEILAATEAKRLNLYHLASLFFHEKAESFSICLEAEKNGVSVSLKNEKKTAKAFSLINSSLHIEPARAENAAVAKAFANAARYFTDYVPPYGLLFGVRPVKVPVFYRQNGYTTTETRAILKEEFLVSEEKAKLLTKLCETELDFQKSLGKRDAMLYLSIPFCPTRCHYCSFISSAAPKHLALIPDYVEQMQSEIRRTAELFRKSDRSLRAVYMGGGTPGILTSSQLETLLNAVRESFDLSSLREFCVEVGRPDTVTEEKLAVLKKMGVGRISINPQTTKDETLSLIGRGHTAEDFYRAMELAHPFAFSSVNCDLIAGLEGERPEDFLQSLRDVLTLSPREITLHALCRKRSADENALPQDPLLWQKAMEEAHLTCIKHGLEPYYLYRQKNAAADLENTGFAKKGSMGVYNLAMMEDLCDIFACGAGGIGKLLPKRKGERIRRFPGFKYPFEYLSHPEKCDERLREMSQYL